MRAENFGRMGDIALRLLKRAADERSFDLVERCRIATSKS
jgi:hypothetical protein